MSLSLRAHKHLFTVLFLLFTCSLTAEDFDREIQQGSFWEFGWRNKGCNTDFPGCSTRSGVFRIVVGEPVSFGSREGFAVRQVWVSGDSLTNTVTFPWKYITFDGSRMLGSLNDQLWRSIVDLNASKQIGGGFFFYEPSRQVSIFPSQISNQFLQGPAFALRTTYGPGGGGCEWIAGVEVCTPKGESVTLVDYFQGPRGPVGHYALITIPNFVSEEHVGFLRFSYTSTERPNLTPALLEGWPDSIVISTEEGTTTDASRITSDDTLYVDFAVGNFGGADVTVEYTIRLSLDGTEIGSWSAPPPLLANYAHFASDVAIGPLSPGDHTLLLEADTSNKVAESNENDNARSKTFTVVASKPLLVFPQWLNGTLGGQFNATRIILRNNSPEFESGKILFQDGEGNPVQVPIGAESLDVVNFSIEPWGSIEVKTDGIGTLKSGTIEVYSSLGDASDLEGSVVFEVLGTYVSVPDSPVRPDNQVYVSVSSDETAGVALYNPDPINPVEVYLQLVDSQGEPQAEQVLTVEPRGQLVAFVDQDQLFGAFFKNHNGDFRGTLNIEAEDGGLSVLGLLQKKSNGALIATSVSWMIAEP